MPIVDRSSWIEGRKLEMSWWVLYTSDGSSLALWEDNIPCGASLTRTGHLLRGEWAVVVADGGGMEATPLLLSVFTPNTCYLWLEGLLKIISVIICLGNVYGETNFPCLCFLQIFALLRFSLSELKWSSLLELSEFWMVAADHIFLWPKHMQSFQHKQFE